MPDPGLFSERTALAWQRSALALAVVGTLFLHAGGLLGIVTGTLLWACAAVTYETGRHPAERPRLVRALAVLTFLAALAAALIATGL
jgi:uncharacterized membrane protein YidH (DUF202 family)